MQTINERLAALPEVLGYDSPAALAKAAGLDPNTLRKAMQGPSKPSYDTLEALLTRFPKLNSDWLLTGNGEMIREGASAFSNATANPKGGTAAKFPMESMEEMEGYEKPAKAPAPAPKTDGEMIKMLLERLTEYKTENGKLHNIIDQQSKMLQGQQEQISSLLGKSDGNPHAPENPGPASPTFVNTMAPVSVLQQRATERALELRAAYGPVLTIVRDEDEVEMAA